MSDAPKIRRQVRKASGGYSLVSFQLRNGEIRHRLVNTKKTSGNHRLLQIIFELVPTTDYAHRHAVHLYNKRRARTRKYNKRRASARRSPIRISLR